MDAAQRAKWITTQHHVLLDGIIDAINMGKAADNGYKREAWEQIKKNLNERFDTTYDIPQLKAALKGLHAPGKASKEN
jgi:Myb/SANT-like DNA-binding domain